MVNSIQKGKRFEREMCRFLTKRLGVLFKRVPNSGGLATSENITNPIFRGDIFTEELPWRSIVFECKFRREPVSLLELFEKPRENNLNGYLQQTWEEAGCFNTLGKNENWCLFVKTNHNKILVFTNNKKIAEEIMYDVIEVRGLNYSFLMGVLN